MVNIFRVFFVFCMLLLNLTKINAEQKQNKHCALIFAEQTLEKYLKILENTSIPMSKRKEIFVKTASENINWTYLTKKIIGSDLSKIKQEHLKEIEPIIKDIINTNWTMKTAYDPKQGIVSKVIQDLDIVNDKISNVTVEIKAPDGKKYELIYMVGCNIGKEGECDCKILNLKFEGVSVVVVYKDLVSSYLEQTEYDFVKFQKFLRSLVSK